MSSIIIFKIIQLLFLFYCLKKRIQIRESLLKYLNLKLVLFTFLWISYYQSPAEKNLSFSLFYNVINYYCV